jgi:hypothetical protein
MSERTQKLVSIRHRTDSDLLVLVNRELRRGAILVDLATTRNSQSFAQAESAVRTATTLLSKISDLSQDDRLRVQSELNELRSRLDQVPAMAKVSYPAAAAS